MKLKAQLKFSLLLALLVGGTHGAETGTGVEPNPAPKTAVVATRQVPPFAIKTDEGWDGIAIELVRRISQEMQVEVEYREMSLVEMLQATIDGEVDAAAGAITITADREQVMDFTHPFYSSELGVASRQRPAVTWLSGIKRVFSGAFLQSMAALLGVLTLIGLLVWLAERRRNSQFQRTPVKGIASGIWWSAVTMTTVGYGDKAPVTLAGRLIGLVWMFASLILISGFTASIASSLTIGELDQSIRGADDLRGKRVLTLPGSTSATYLDEHLIRYTPATTLLDALAMVAADQADAVVYDAPILRYLISQHHAQTLHIAPTVFARQDYGIALPPGSPLREQLNRLILRITRSPEWDAMLNMYLGRAR